MRGAEISEIEYSLNTKLGKMKHNSFGFYLATIKHNGFGKYFENNEWAIVTKEIVFDMIISYRIGELEKIKQFYIHRHLVADLILSAKNSGQREKTSIADDITLLAEYSNDNFSLFLQIDDQTFPFEPNYSKDAEAIKSDYQLLEKIRSVDSKLPNYKKSVIKMLNPSWADNYQSMASIYSDKDLEVIAFEYALLKPLKLWKKKPSMTHFYHYQEKKELTSIQLQSNLISYSLKIDSSDLCGECESNCQCDLLAKSSKRYFSDLKKNDSGKYNMEEIESAYSTFAKNATRHQIALLNGMDAIERFSPLLTMNFWDPEFSLDDYLHKLSMEYSSLFDEELTRSIVTMAMYYVKLHQDQMYI
jgi:hypothetical protein